MATAASASVLRRRAVPRRSVDRLCSLMSVRAMLIIPSFLCSTFRLTASSVSKLLACPPWSACSCCNRCSGLSLHHKVRQDRPVFVRAPSHPCSQEMFVDNLCKREWHINAIRRLENQFHILESHRHGEASIAIVALPDHAAVPFVDRSLEEGRFHQHT